MPAMGNAGGVFGVCEACQAPRSEQDMICARCGYHFKTKPVPAFPSDGAPTRRTDPPLIVESPRTVLMPASAPLPPPTQPVAVPPTMQSAGASPESAPRTLHSPSSPPGHDRPVVPVGNWTPPPPPPRSAPSRRSSAAPWVLGIVGVIVLASAAVLFVALRHGVPSSPLVARTVYFESGGEVSFGHLDTSPAEDFVGRYYELEGTAMAFYVGAFSGDDFHEIWRTGPVDLRAAGGPLPFAVVGSRVLVADVRPLLHVHDGATGHETHQVELADRATRIVVHGDKEAFIEVAGGKHVLYDAALGRAKITPPPAWVPPLPSAHHCGLAQGSRSTCLEDARTSRIAAFSSKRAIGAGDLGVALGRTTASPSLRVVGFSLSSGAELWRTPVCLDPHYTPSDEETLELDGDAAFATWGDAATPHVVAFSTKDGARRWESEPLPTLQVPFAPRVLVVSPTRVYVPRATSLSVLDRATGKILGGVGATK